MFSRSTTWHRKPNRLAEVCAQRTRTGQHLRDLTASNPTTCGIPYPGSEILRALTRPEALQYEPDPHGLFSTREAIAAYYGSHNLRVEPGSIFLTSSTSEAYELVFTLLCDPNDSVATPRPSYPLFEYLTQIRSIKDTHYHLVHEGQWHLDTTTLEESITAKTRAIVVVNPHNPTGMVLTPDEVRFIAETAADRGCALISDEVFGEYPLGDTVIRSSADIRTCLTFTLNGISKLIGLPQMKLGWIVVSGPPDLVREATERLEILCDTFLSVNTPVQLAVPDLLRNCRVVKDRIRERVRGNYRFLRSELGKDTGCTVLETEAGWSAVMRIPRIKSDEEWAIDLLNRYGILLFPGYFFDFMKEGYLITSLLPDPAVFQPAIVDIANHFRNAR